MKTSFIKKTYKECLTDNRLSELKNYVFKNDEITVSIICLCFNHAKYLARCLDSLLVQKVDFNVEILIHDDASTDGSIEILNQYQQKYPNIVVPVFEKENQYSKGVNIENAILSKLVRGKYVAICECDDYWSDPFKLVTQVRLFEANPDCHFVTHRVKRESIDGIRLGYVPYEHFKTGCYPRTVTTALVFEEYRFHTTSYMFKGEEYKKYCANLPYFAKEMNVGDYALQLYFSNLGDTIYIDKEMSVHVHDVPGSWTAKTHADDDFQKSHREKMEKCYNLFDEFTNFEFHHALLKRLATSEMHELYKNKEYEKIVNNKNYSAALKKYDPKSLRTIRLMVKHPRIYSMLKKLRRSK